MSHQLDMQKQAKQEKDSGAYSYRYGDYKVTASFSDTDVSLEERMLAYIRIKCEES